MKNKDLKKLLNKMFTELRKCGFFAKQNFLFSDSDGWSVIPEYFEDAVFYNGQTYDDVFKYGYNNTVYLAWDGNVLKIIEVAKSVGLSVEWEGTEDKKVCVFLPK